MQSWLPPKATDPEFQHEIISLRNQLAELRQRLGEEPPPDGNIHYYLLSH
jgi:hypothetical protein